MTERTAPSKNIVFDIVGTCVSFDTFFTAIETRLGAKLSAEGISPRLLGYAWMEAAEREYSYLSISGSYVSFINGVFPHLFYRILHMAGISSPRTFANDTDIAYLVNAYYHLRLRPGLATCFARLRDAGFKIWALTTGDIPRVRGYFLAGNVDMPEENFLSCNQLAVGKPDPRVYKFALEKLGGDGNAEKPWYAAAHTWDVAAARRNGFRSAWCSVFEKEACVEIFGEMDVTADSLPELAEKIIDASTST